MITIQKTIDFVSLWLLAVCILSLCLVPAPCAAASSTHLSAADELFVDPPEIPLPFPPPLLA